MKTFQILFTGLVVTVLLSCSTTKQTDSAKNLELQKDSVEYYDAEVQIRQKDFSPLLVGGWQVTTMKRQARIEEEALTNVHLEFKKDATFSGKGGCNNIRGTYELKGSSIKFSNIISTKMACQNLEQEAAFLQLLEGTVSAFSIKDNQLLLRDGSSNVLFKATKQ